MSKGSRFHAALNPRVWARVRRAMLDAAGWRCTRCGLASRLEVHHRIPLEKGGDAYADSNLQVLCVSCHVDHHRQTSTDPERFAFRAYVQRMASLYP